MEIKARKFYVLMEEIKRDGEREVSKDNKRVSVAVVAENPFAGEYVDDLTPLIEWSAKMAPILTGRALATAGMVESDVESYGKACVVGGNGELEHAAAVLHPKLGKPFREKVGGGKAIIPSAKKMGYPGCSIDVPLHFKDAAFVRSHFDAMEVRLPDAPRDNEIVLILTITNCGRPHPRVDGLTKESAKCEDGLR